MATLPPNEALARWQSLRDAGYTPSERLDVLMREFFAPPTSLDVEYDIALRNVAYAMQEAA